MINKNTEPAKLVIYNRDGLIEREHFGYIVRCDKLNVVETIGDDKNYPFYLRSCAKPLQAALMFDYELDKKYNLTDDEIAICAASHAGEKIHIDIIKRLLEKFEIPIKKLKCGIHEPISKSAQNKLLLNSEEPTVLHNNCSGKHTMMLGLCKLNDWDMDNYDNINHPLQQQIKNKIYELCEIKSEYPITKDGCGVPIHSMPLKNMVRGYLNLFCNPKYERLTNAFINCPYIIGGENRTDTKIIQNSKDIIAKVGAGGLCIVVNTKIEEAFVVKICDTDMNAREIAAIDLINNLHWANIEISHNIETNNHDIIGYVETLL
jgi:L-asparaginase II